MICEKTIYLKIKDFDEIKEIDSCKIYNPQNRHQFLEKAKDKIFVWDNNGLMVYCESFNEDNYIKATEILCDLFLE